jgi:hypothetical protein
MIVPSLQQAQRYFPPSTATIEWIELPWEESKPIQRRLSAFLLLGRAIVIENMKFVLLVHSVGGKSSALKNWDPGIKSGSIPVAELEPSSAMATGVPIPEGKSSCMWTAGESKQRMKY